MGCGSVTFQRAVSWKQPPFSLPWSRTGAKIAKLQQTFDQDHHVEKCVSDLEPVTVWRGVEEILDEPSGPKLHSCFRGALGQLQWLQLQETYFSFRNNSSSEQIRISQWS